MNNVIMMGRLTRDPELRNTASGIEVANFSIAVDRYAKPGEEKKADFFNCVAWRGTGVLVQKYYHKGDGILLEGAVENREWKDKDGNNRISTEIIVSDIHFLPLRKPNGYAPDDSIQNEPQFAEVSVEDTGDLPF